MVSVETIGSIFIKALKMVMNRKRNAIENNIVIKKKSTKYAGKNVT